MPRTGSQHVRLRQRLDPESCLGLGGVMKAYEERVIGIARAILAEDAISARERVQAMVARSRSSQHHHAAHYWEQVAKAMETLKWQV